MKNFLKRIPHGITINAVKVAQNENIQFPD